jgi:hypothetical protein
MDRAVTAGDDEFARGGQLRDALRFAEPANPRQAPARGKIDHLNAAVGDFGDEQPLAGNIDREMINTAVHAGSTIACSSLSGEDASWGSIVLTPEAQAVPLSSAAAIAHLALPKCRKPSLAASCIAAS